jgi:hypothetical protein
MIKAMQKPNSEPKSKRGGERPNAGRPATETPAKNVTIRLTDEQAEILKKAGGAPFIRGILDLLKGLIK